MTVSVSRVAIAGWAAALAIGLFSTAGAQTAQTPEGAQKFLGVVAAQGTTKLYFDSSSNWSTVYATRKFEKCVQEATYDFFGFQNGTRSRCFDDSDSKTINAPARDLKAASATGACSTRFEFSDYFQGQRDGDWEFGPTGRTTYVVNWAKIASVKADGSWVRLSPPLQGFHLLMASPDMATRMAFAMEFLRQSCDAAAATGF